MVGKAQKVRLGIFITLLTILLIVAIVFIAGDKLMEEWDFYHIYYSGVSVNGLQVGGQVRYHGIEIGKVDDIRISPEDVSRVEVIIKVTKGTPIKTNVAAHLVLVGITGLKVVELTGGTNESPNIMPGSEIPPGTSVLDNITGKAEVMAEKLELIMNNILTITDEANQERIASILVNVDSILTVNQEPVAHTITNLDSISSVLLDLLESSHRIVCRIDSLLWKAEMDSMINNFSDVSQQLSEIDLVELIGNLNETILQINQTISKIDLTVIRSQEDIVSTIESLREAVEYLEDFSRRISEDPTILLRRSNQ